MEGLQSITFPGLDEKYIVAPGGYGYGEAPVYLGSTTDDAVFLTKLNEQFDLTTGKTRQVRFVKGGVTYIGTLWNAGNGYGTLTANSYTDAETGALFTKIIRNCANGNWQPWEYENPPMKNNTEYRTTERCGAKPVYVKRINYGALAAANTTVTIPLNVDGTISSIVDFEILTTLASGNVFKFPVLNLYEAKVLLSGYCDPTQKGIVLQTHSDLSSATAMVVVKYTKA